MKRKRDTKKASFDYESFEEEAISKLRSGKGLTGEGGALTGLISRIVTAAFEGEISEHLSQEDQGSNRRNGYTNKKIKTGLGPLEVNPPRDRNGSFEPEIIKKWDRNLAPELESQILSLYSIGTSYADISEHLKKMYGLSYSPSFISAVTDRVLDEITAWKSRPLDAVYAIIYLDAIHYKVRENRQVVTKAVYTVLGVDLEGQRDVLGLFIGESEGARYWARVLENIKDRGVKDVFFFCVDGLNGFSQTIESIYPQAIVQRCIVHMVRTSLKYVSWKDYRAVCKDLKLVYTQDSLEAAEEYLNRFKETWNRKYPEIAEKWEANWAELSPFFDYPEPIRRVIYTTNAVESLHRCLRKATKTKGAFISEQALEKQLYLTLQYNQKSWKRKVRSWPEMARTFRRVFADRFPEGVD
ncbi:MAG: IS256 family transposase [Bacteroidetes bacterium]|nr:IS256 family transposase [Bacteroidota bacterium]